MTPIRVLHVFGTLNAGGAESRTMDIYRRLDREKVQFDFLIHTPEKCFFEDEITSLGGKIYRVPRFSNSTLFTYIGSVRDFFKLNPEYNIVHGHMLSTAYIYMREAKKAGVKIRIGHSRCGSRTEINLVNAIKESLKRLSRYEVTHKLAVSKIAGYSAFGKKSVDNGETLVIPNAIKTENYLFNDLIRQKARKDLNVDDKFVIGHVGRFTYQKNHEFIIEIFKKLKIKNPEAVLILVGEGEDLENVNALAEHENLVDDIIFTGVRNDVSSLMQAFDVLLFPSLFEGLPGVVLEAQAAGLPCVISDQITQEVKITNLVNYVSLDKDVNYWTEKILKYSKGFERRNTYEEIVQAGYDIESVAKWYERFYLKFSLETN